MQQAINILTINILTINKTITTLGSVLKYAVRSKLIDSNPVHDVERPKVTALAQVEGTEEKDVQVISKDQVNTFWAVTTSGLYRMLLDSADHRDEIGRTVRAAVGRHRLAGAANPCPACIDSP